MSSFGQVIPVIGTGFGFIGEVSRTGGGDPFIISRQSNAANLQNINFGDAVVFLPDSTGGTCKQFADWVATGGGLAIVTGTATSVTATPVSMAGLSVGMMVSGPGVPAGTFITSVNYAAGTITLSKATTTTVGANPLTYGIFAGWATRETKTNLAYPYNPNAGGVIGAYRPGEWVGVLVRGSMTLKVNVGVPVAGGPVYLRTILNGAIPNGLVGGIEAAPDGVNNILLNSVPPVAQAFFKTGAVGAGGETEVTVLSRIAA
jgi:hypothetical protein